MQSTGSFKYRKLKNCKCFKIRKASRLITQVYDKKLQPLGLKITQFSILSFIATSGEKNLIKLANELYMDRTTLTRGLEILKKKKYIKNLGDKDSRKRIVSLTKEGVAILDKAIPLWMEAEEEIFEESKKYNFSIL
jgi:DNA-binding MarR family transcriptional regulator